MIDELFAANGGLATTQQLEALMSHKTLRSLVRAGTITRVWHGVYSQRPPDDHGRLAALDLVAGRPIVACMNTAADLYAFNTEPDDRIHILNPGIRMRPNKNLRMHQRVGAPLERVRGRLATAPAWRIIHVRELVAHADGRAESAMESETRLVFIDGGLPVPELQYEIVDLLGRLWRVDFAWPEAMLVAEYDSAEWHAKPDAFKHDRMKTARLQECGWTTIPVVVDDVRRYPADLVARIYTRLERGRLAS
jgi:hypothetical protein